MNTSSDNFFHYHYAQSPPSLTPPVGNEGGNVSFLNAVSESFFQLPSSLNTSLVMTEDDKVSISSNNCSRSRHCKCNKHCKCKCECNNNCNNCKSRHCKCNNNNNGNSLSNSPKPRTIMIDAAQDEAVEPAAVENTSASTTLIADMGCTQQAPLLFLPETQYATPAIGYNGNTLSASILKQQPVDHSSFHNHQNYGYPSIATFANSTTQHPPLPSLPRIGGGPMKKGRMADRLFGDFEEVSASPFAAAVAVDEDSLLMALDGQGATEEDSLLAAIEQSMAIVSSSTMSSSLSKENAHSLDDQQQQQQQQKQQLPCNFLDTPPLPVQTDTSRIKSTQTILQAFAPSPRTAAEANMSGLLETQVFTHSHSQQQQQQQQRDILPGPETDCDTDRVNASQDLLMMMDIEEEDEEEGHDSVIFPASFDDDGNNPFIAGSHEQLQLSRATGNGVDAEVDVNDDDDDDTRIETLGQRIFKSNSDPSFGTAAAVVAESGHSMHNSDPLSRTPFDSTLSTVIASTATATATAKPSVKVSTSTAPLSASRQKPSLVPLAMTPLRIAGQPTSATATAAAKIALPMTAALKTSLSAARLHHRPEQQQQQQQLSNTGQKRGSSQCSAPEAASQKIPRTPCAEPRKTPLPGALSLSLALQLPSSSASASASAMSSRIVTPRKSSQLLATASTDCDSDESPVAISAATSQQLVFFKDPACALFTVGLLMERASRTRDLWRVKSCASGAVYCVPMAELASVRKLQSGDSVCVLKGDGGKCLGPFRFAGFSADGRLAMLGSSQEEEAKVSKLAIERDLFLSLSGRADFSVGETETCVTLLNPSSLTAPVKRRSSLSHVTTAARDLTGLTATSATTTQHTTTTFSPSTKRLKSALFSGMRFLITCGSGEEEERQKLEYSRLIEAQGGELLSGLDAEVPLLKTFLLASSFKRTPKFMTAIVRGVPRVSFAWIDACIEQKRVVDVAAFTIEPPSGWKPTGPLFKGRRFFLDGSAKFKHSWAQVLRLLGGTVCNAIGGTAKLIAFTEDPERRRGTVKGCERVVNVDWLIRCIVERSFVVE